MTRPTLEVLAAEIVHIRELLDHLGDAAVERQKQSDAAIASALAAQEKATNAAFASSEKAIAKAEEAQNAYNAGHNNLAAKLDTQAKDMTAQLGALLGAFVSRHDHDAASARTHEKIEEVRDEVAKLRDSGKDEALKTIKDQMMWVRGAVLTSALSLLGLVVTVVIFLLGGG